MNDSVRNEPGMLKKDGLRSEREATIHVENDYGSFLIRGADLIGREGMRQIYDGTEIQTFEGRSCSGGVRWTLTVERNRNGEMPKSTSVEMAEYDAKCDKIDSYLQENHPCDT